MMDEVSTEVRLRGYLKRVTAELSQTRQRLREVESAGNEPIAIVGMACRYPGADSPEELWDLVVNGRDAVTEFPRDRGWDLDTIYDPTGQRPNTSYVNTAGFLSNVSDFDASFFGISDREALVMDPQQRIMLEMAWEALEHARIAPTSLRGTNGAVYCGAVGNEYGPRLDRADDNLKDHLAVGGSSSILTGRIAYSLGITGPAVTVDTGSSSSPVAIHVAVRGLRAGDCDLALSGGVSVIPNPTQFIEYSRTKSLSPTGRGKPFDEAADGTNHSEGAGILVLERLSDAHRNNHRVLAVIRGSAISHNGTSNGLTTTNTPAAERLFRRALADARLGGGDVDMLEAHTSGTALSAPIEVQAMQSVYGSERSADDPVYLGTMKSSFGHSAAAAGVGGVIKLVMSLRKQVMPMTIVETPSSLVDWSSGTVRLLTSSRPWSATGHPRRASVTSFGYNGTNAHLILEETPSEVETVDSSAEARGLTAPVTPWVVSAKSQAALRGQAANLLSHIDSQDEPSALDVGYSLATTRATYDERAVVLAADRTGFQRGLLALRDGEQTEELIRGSVAEGALAVLVTGWGRERRHVGRDLYRRSRVFASEWDAVCAQADKWLAQPLSQVLFGDDFSPRSEEPQDQAALFALQVAIYRMIEAWGLKPEFVAGQSTAALSAAYMAGALSLREACKLAIQDKQLDLEMRFLATSTGDDVPAGRLAEAGVNTVLVIGPDPDAVKATPARLGNPTATVIPMLLPNEDESTTVASAVAAAHVAGFAVDWNAYFSGSNARRVDLPTYAYQRTRYWINPGTTSLDSAEVSHATE